MCFLWLERMVVNCVIWPKRNPLIHQIFVEHPLPADQNQNYLKPLSILLGAQQVSLTQMALCILTRVWKKRQKAQVSLRLALCHWRRKAKAEQIESAKPELTVSH